VLLVAINIGAAIWDVRNDLMRTEARMRRDTSNMARLIAEQTASALEAVDLVLRDAAREGSAAKAAALAPRLKDEIVHLPQVRAISVLDADGRVVASSNDAPATGSPFSHRSYFTAQRDGLVEGVFLSEPYQAIANEGWHFGMSRRLQTPDGRFDGVVAASLAIDRFDRLYRAIDVGEGGFINVRTRDGTVITRVPDLLKAQGQKFPNAEVSLAIAREGRFTGWTTSPILNDRVLASTVAVRGFPLEITAGATERAVLAPWYAEAWRIAVRTVVTSTAMLVLIALAAWGLSRREQAQQRERSWRNLTEALPQLVWAATPDGACDYFSTQWSEYTGVAETDLLGWRWMEVLHPDDREHTRQVWGDAVAGRRPYDVEYRIRTQDGAYGSFKTRGTPIRDSEGRIIKWFGTCTDISDQKRAEQALYRSEQELRRARDQLEMKVADRTAELQRSETRYRNIFQTVGVSIMEEDFSQLKAAVDALKNSGIKDFRRYLAANPQFLRQAISLVRIVDVNDVTLKLFAAESKSELLASLDRVFVPETDQVFVEELVALAEGRTSFEAETILRTLQGKRLTVLFTMTFPPPHAGFESVLVSVTDITERKLAEAERARLEQRLRQSEKMEAVGRLAGGIAHDFNNILGGILGYGEMLDEESPPGSPLKRYAQNVLTGANRARGLVDQILTYSRSQRGTRGAIDLARVVAETLELVRGSLADGVQLETHLPSEPMPVIGDATQLHQVAMNLCTNAIQAMDGAGKLVVTLVAADLETERILQHGILAPGPYARLTVEDSGPGMDEATLARIFEPFFTTKEVGKGTGLGLSLVYGIVTDSGGAIEVTSRPGQATAFTIYLPRAEVPVEAAMQGASPAPRGHGEQVLVVDDEETLLAVTAEMLSRMGYRPFTFSDSRAALAEFESNPGQFDAVITDEVMPHLAGTEFAARLRQRQAGIPVVLMSGYIGPMMTERAAAAGITEILKKPVQSRDLAMALAHALDGSRPPAESPAP
jgi:PAS domain S-box-containing protein